MTWEFSDILNVHVGLESVVVYNRKNVQCMKDIG